MAGWFERIEIDFLVAGHTKFSPDRMFGWMSHVLRVSDYFSKSDMVRLFSRKKQKYESQVVPDLLLWSLKIESAFKQIHGIQKLQTISCSRVDTSVRVVGATSHRPDATKNEIRFNRPDTPLSPETPILCIQRKNLPTKLLEDLRKAQQFVLGPETIEYVTPNNGPGKTIQ